MNEKKDLFLLFAILCLAAGLRLYHLGGYSLWYDEIITAHRSAQSLAVILANKGSLNPPLHYLIVHLLRCFGDSAALIRLPAVIFGLLGIMATYLVGKTFFNSAAGLLGAYLLAISPAHIYYSQEARAYTQFIFFSLLTLFFCYLAIKENKNRYWWGFVIATGLNIYTHYFAFLILAVELIFVLFSKKRKAMVVSLLVIAAFSLLLVPYLIRIKYIFGGEKSLLAQSLADTLNPLRLFGLQENKLFWYLYPALFILGVIGSLKKKPKETMMLICWIVVPVLILSLLPIKHFFTTRYLLFLLPACCLLLARGIVMLKPVYLSLLVVLITVGHWPAVTALYQWPKDNWRAAAQYLAQRAQPGEIILVDNTMDVFCLKYYYKNLRLTAERQDLLKKEFNEKDIWYVSHSQYLPDKIDSYLCYPLEQIDFGSHYVHLYRLGLTRDVIFKEAETGYDASRGWSLSVDGERNTLAGYYTGRPQASVSYQLIVPEAGEYALYACLRRDSERASLCYRLDNGERSSQNGRSEQSGQSSWSLPIDPRWGKTLADYNYENILLGEEYLSAGTYTLTFKNSPPYTGLGYQNIDYFFLIRKRP